MSIEWPSVMIPAKEAAWRPRQVIRQLSVATDGLFQPRRRTDMGGKWELTMSGAWLRSADQVRTARAVRVISNGGMVPFVVRTCEGRFANWLPGASSSGVPHSDDTPFSDDTLYYSEGVSVEINAVAARNATTIQVGLTAASKFRGGEALSIVHPNMGERRYEVGMVEDVSAGVQNLMVWPLVREALDGSESVRLKCPGCLMGLINYEDFMDPIRMNRWSGASPVFMEWGDDAP